MNLTLNLTDNVVFIAVYTALLAGVVAAAKNLIPQALWLLASIFVTKRCLQDRGDAAIVLRYLQRRVPREKLGQDAVNYTTSRFFVRPLREIRSVWFRVVGVKTQMFVYNGAPILYLKELGYSNVANADQQSQLKRYSTMIFLRSTVNWTKLLAEVDAYEAEQLSKKSERGGNYTVRRYFVPEAGKDNINIVTDVNSTGSASIHHLLDPVHFEEVELGPEQIGSAADDLALTPALRTVIQKAKAWNESREWYAEHLIPWRTGFAFVGRPGTGKTSLIRAIGVELDIPVNSIDMSRATNVQFAQMWEQCRHFSARRIVVLEDIDTIFHLREPANPEIKMTFEALLNTIDGVKREDGLILIVTSNRPELIDPALGVLDEDGRSTRPGRVDDVIVFPDALDLDGRVKLADRILDSRDISAVVEAGATDSPAQFSARCVEEALMRRNRKI